MHVLISNDDGVDAPGIQILAEHLATIGRVSVVAPDRDRSGASNSLTLEHPVRVQQAANGFYYVNGTPTDCVHVAISSLLDRTPDLVVSGINSGENLADDVFYSGTVAAAMEGMFLGSPAIAVSLAGHDLAHYDTAAWAVRQLVSKMLAGPPANGRLLNVNVPDLPRSAVKGFRATRLGQRHKAAAVIEIDDPRGRPVYWIGPAGIGDDTGPGTDFEAIAGGYV